MPSSDPRPWAETLHRALREHERLRLSLGITPEDPALSTPEHLLLGRMAVEKQLISSETLEECLREQAEMRGRGELLPLGHRCLTGFVETIQSSKLVEGGSSISTLQRAEHLTGDTG